MKKTIMSLMVMGALSLMLVPQVGQAYEGTVSGWVPWFQELPGIVSVLQNIDKLDTVYPFVYEIDSQGQIVDKTVTKMDGPIWPLLTKLLQAKEVTVIPTIAWFDGQQIDEILSDDRNREAHVADIVALVKKGNYDGINIDYEQKLAKTRDDFSSFLQELKAELGNKRLSCAVEARMPLDSRFKNIPSDYEYANDYEAIGKYCDRVEIMAYDQQRADIKLNEERSGVPYMPVADKDWVEKVIKESLKELPKEKVVLGVATYGRAWDVAVAPNWYRDYTRVASLNHPRIVELAAKYKTSIGRTAGGEGAFSYFPEDSIYQILNALPTPAGTRPGYEAAAKALLFADATKTEIPVRFVTYSDASAIGDKLTLIDKYKLNGVTIFKIDGEEDQKMWNLFR